MAATTTKHSEKREKSVYEGNVHIQATFNNTIITITDLNGNTIAWSSSAPISSGERKIHLRRPDGRRNGGAEGHEPGPGKFTFS